MKNKPIKTSQISPPSSRVSLAVRVQPGAKVNEVLGWTGEGTKTVLKLRLRALALEGKANGALIEFLAEILDLKPRHISLKFGQKSRDKVVKIEGLTFELLENKILACLTRPA